MYKENLDNDIKDAIETSNNNRLISIWETFTEETELIEEFPVGEGKYIILSVGNTTTGFKIKKFL